MTAVTSEMVWYESRKKEEGCQIKVEVRNKAKIEMLNGRTRMNSENYKNKQRQANKMCRVKKKKAYDLKVLDGTKAANKRNETRKFYTKACRMKAGFQQRTSICKDGDNNLIGDGRLIM
jgi:hypothetical protein